MQITDVRVRKVSEEGKMRGIVSVTFDNAFVVHDIKIIEGQSGLFIAMPSRKVGEGEFRDIAHPINSQMRQELQSHILRAFEETKLRIEVESEHLQFEQEGADVLEEEDQEKENIGSDEQTLQMGSGGQFDRIRGVMSASQPIDPTEEDSNESSELDEPSYPADSEE